MASLRREVEGRRAVRSRRVDDSTRSRQCTGFSQRAQNRRVSELRCEVECVEAVGVGGAWGGAVLEERCDEIRVAHSSTQVQRSPPSLRTRVDARASLEKHERARCVPVLRGEMESAPAVWRGGVNRGAAIEDRRCGCGVALGHSTEQIATRPLRLRLRLRPLRTRGGAHRANVAEHSC